jgi:hypothetical protein
MAQNPTQDHPDWELGPVIGVQIYKRDVVVKRARMTGPKCHTDNKRGDIMNLSKASRKRLAFVANNTEVAFRTMITLTYPGEYTNDGKEVKAHLHKFLRWCRYQWDDPSYLWFLEFQKRGAPHIHILLDISLSTIAERREVVYNAVRREWYKVVGSGDPKHLAAGTRVEMIRKPDGAARYCLKYAYKCEQKAVPPAYRSVGRFWGCSRDVTPDKPRTIPIDDLSIRAILADWDYCPNAHTPVYQTLFGVADRFRAYSGIRALEGFESQETEPVPLVST